MIVVTVIQMTFGLYFSNCHKIFFRFHDDSKSWCSLMQWFSVVFWWSRWKFANWQKHHNRCPHQIDDHPFYDLKRYRLVHFILSFFLDSPWILMMILKKYYHIDRNLCSEKMENRSLSNFCFSLLKSFVPFHLSSFDFFITENISYFVVNYCSDIIFALDMYYCNDSSTHYYPVYTPEMIACYLMHFYWVFNITFFFSELEDSST